MLIGSYLLHVGPVRIHFEDMPVLLSFKEENRSLPASQCRHKSLRKRLDPDGRGFCDRCIGFPVLLKGYENTFIVEAFAGRLELPCQFWGNPSLLSCRLTATIWLKSKAGLSNNTSC